MMLGRTKFWQSGNAARHDLADPWTQTAVLSSARQSAPALLTALAHDPEVAGRPTADHLRFLTRLAALVGAQGGDKDLAGALGLLGDGRADPGGWRAALLDGLGQGLHNSRRLARVQRQEIGNALIDARFAQWCGQAVLGREGRGFEFGAAVLAHEAVGDHARGAS